MTTAPLTTVQSPSELLDLDGADLGRHRLGAPSPRNRWILFADSTGDHQWIHVDVERANAESPFGGPIAHGYLTLSMVNLFLPQLLEVQDASMGVNVGLDKVRFPAPVPVGSRLRGRRSDRRGRRGQGRRAGHDDAWSPSSAEGADKPVCVVESLSRYLG
jgi:acyl dehydratase